MDALAIDQYLEEQARQDLDAHVDYVRTLPVSDNMTDEEAWHNERLFGIGASESAAIMGLNKWKSPIQVWEEKRRLVEPEDLSDNVRVRVGVKSEDAVADMYAEDHGVSLRRHKAKAMKGSPWVRANPDRLIVGQRKGLECKTGRLTSDWGPSGTDQVPMSYLIQCLHCMMVFEYDEWDLAAWLFGPGGIEVRYYTIKRNDILIAKIKSRLRAFWIDNVVAGVKPEPTTLVEVNQYYPKDDGNQVIAPDSIAVECGELKRIKAEIKDLESLAKAKEADIKAALGDGSTLVDQLGNKLATWKTQSRTSFNTTAFKKAHPEMVEAYTSANEYRVFRL